MISNKLSLSVLVIVLVAGCGSGSGSDFSSSVGSSITGSNVMSVTVNGSLCSPSTSASYPNKPCVSVTVCNPNGSLTCQTIDDILLDTGSYGLRIFKSVLSPALSFTQITAGSGSLAECAPFVAGSIWGPVQRAGVTLASEPTVDVPIQIIDPTFANISTSSTSTICPDADQSPATAGYNGLLGVGVFSANCGPACANNKGNGIYYSCTGSICSGTTVTIPDQVQNPVALLPQDYNGVIVMLPGVPSSGAASVNGSLVLGIGTQANNVPSGVTAYPTDGFGDIITIIDGTTTRLRSFIDSGSNGLFFTPPVPSQLPNCNAPNAVWFCPPSTVNLSATNSGAFGTPSNTVSFEIGNLDSLANSSNYVFSNLGGNTPVPGIFDWGLPFYLGRNVYVGIYIDGKPPTSLGPGPFYAY